MSHPRKFRFAAQLSKAPEGSARSWAEQARKAEDLGYSTLLVPDHFGDQLAPVPALMAAADATSALRVGTLVFDNDYRHPVVLAKEAATLDLLSGGRLELGLGAGWMRSDYEESGISYDPPGLRVERFAEGLAVIAGLLESDGPFSFSGKHYTVTGHSLQPRPVQRPRPPLISGRRRTPRAHDRGPVGGRREHQRRPTCRDGWRGDRSQRVAGRHPSEGGMGQGGGGGRDSTTSSSTA